MNYLPYREDRLAVASLRSEGGKSKIGKAPRGRGREKTRRRRTVSGASVLQVREFFAIREHLVRPRAMHRDAPTR